MAFVASNRQSAACAGQRQPEIAPALQRKGETGRCDKGPGETLTPAVAEADRVASGAPVSDGHAVTNPSGLCLFSGPSSASLTKGRRWGHSVDLLGLGLDSHREFD